MSVEELNKHRNDLLQESLHLRLQQQSGQLENPARLRIIRREVARAATIINERARKAVTAA